MKAAIYMHYGPPDVVQVRDWPMPVPKPAEVLVRIRASTVSSADWRARTLDMPPGFAPFGRLAFGLFKPRNPILGVDFAGEVAAVGDGVTGWQVGDRVFGATGFGMACHAQFRRVKASGAMAPIPPTLDVAQATALPFGGMTALFFLRDRAGLRPGERLLVIGASGAVGSAAVQIARLMGARVTGVCSAANADLVRGLGAEAVIDYAQTDFTTTGQVWDVIMDCTGTTRFATCRKVLAPHGRLLLVLGGLGALIAAPFQSREGGQRVLGGTGTDTAADMQKLADMAAKGDFNPVISAIYPLADIAAAHAHVATGRKVGSVVIVMPD